MTRQGISYSLDINEPSKYTEQWVTNWHCLQFHDSFSVVQTDGFLWEYFEREQHNNDSIQTWLPKHQHMWHCPVFYLVYGKVMSILKLDHTT